MFFLFHLFVFFFDLICTLGDGASSFNIPVLISFSLPILHPWIWCIFPYSSFPFILFGRLLVGGSISSHLTSFVMLLVDGHLTFDWRRTLARLESACLSAGKQVAMIASIILCASIIIGVLSITGLGVKITSLILSGAGGRLWPSLLLTALACLVLGMEVPTTAAYVICVSVAGPALADLGLDLLLVHLFVFWYALLSTITPPVCGTVFIAAGMVGENWLKVSVRALALGIGLYLIPLAMVAQPALTAARRRLPSGPGELSTSSPPKSVANRAVASCSISARMLG